MLTNLLFGVQHSPQRKACIGLSLLICLLGLILFPVRGWEYGLTFLLIGLLSGAVLTRVFAAREERAATTEQLERLSSGAVDDAVAQAIVDHARTDLPPGRVTGEVDPDELRRLREP